MYQQAFTYSVIMKLTGRCKVLGQNFSNTNFIEIVSVIFFQSSSCYKCLHVSINICVEQDAYYLIVSACLY